MAATGTEYVTLEQLKDLVTNMIQPLVDAVGTAGNVYGVPVDLASDGTVTLAVGGSVTIHQNETMFVCSSEYAGFTAGTIAEYNGSSSVELSDSAGQNIAAELVAVYVPTSGTAEVPVGTLSVQGEYEQVFKKTEGGTEPVAFLLISEDQIENTLRATKPLTIIGTDGDIPAVQFARPNEEGGLDLAFALSIASSGPEGSPKITASDLASAKKVPRNFNPNGYALILE